MVLMVLLERKRQHSHNTKEKADGLDDAGTV
jgi:hypothetical protein